MSAYESIFDRMNRKEKRAFDGLPTEEKMQIFANEYQNACMASMKEEIVNSFYRGFLQAHKMLAEKYLVPISQSEDELEVMELFTKMLEEISRNRDIAAVELENALNKDKKVEEEDATLSD